MNLWVSCCFCSIPVWKGRSPGRRKAFAGFQKKPESRVAARSPGWGWPNLWRARAPDRWSCFILKKRSTSIEKTQLGTALQYWLCRGPRPMSLSYLRCTRPSPITCATPVSVILRLSLCKTPCAEYFLEKPGHSVRQTQIGACNFRTATNKTLVLPTSAVPSTSASPSE
jgi:hypothetical protein